MWELTITNYFGGRRASMTNVFNTYQELENHVHVICLMEGDVPKETESLIIHPILGKLLVKTTKIKED